MESSHFLAGIILGPDAYMKHIINFLKSMSIQRERNLKV